jgi:hypothetical protein
LISYTSVNNAFSGNSYLLKSDVYRGPSVLM